MKTLQLFHNDDLLIDASTICSLYPLDTIGNICLKSPPRTIVFPPKGVSPLFELEKRSISLNDRSTTSKQFQCAIGASSQIIRLAFVISFAICEPCLISQVELFVTFIGI